VQLLAEKGAGKQRADDDGRENLFHGLALAEREARGNVGISGAAPFWVGFDDFSSGSEPKPLLMGSVGRAGPTGGMKIAK
jgi:hypothetical protein